MNDISIGFIGAGNMAQAIIGGLLKTGSAAKQIAIYEPNEALSIQLSESLGVLSVANCAELCAQCDVIVLAIKPQVMESALEGLRSVSLQENAFIISVAAGVPISAMQNWMGAQHPLVRVMPNTPALVGAGISGLFASPQVSDTQKQTAESVLRAVGSVIWVDNEDLIDAVTAVSGSGPAYFFYYIEALEKAALENGLNAEQARLLSLETAFGAAKMAMESEVSAATLRERVTSPGGTTAAALKVLNQRKVAKSLGEAVNAAVQRAKELADIATK